MKWQEIECRQEAASKNNTVVAMMVKLMVAMAITIAMTMAATTTAMRTDDTDGMVKPTMLLMMVVVMTMGGADADADSDVNADADATRRRHAVLEGEQKVLVDAALGQNVLDGLSLCTVAGEGDCTKTREELRRELEIGLRRI